MRFQHYDSLRIFSIVAAHDSFASAAQTLNLTKGAVSHQIRGLEQALGFALFTRLPRGIALTPRGQDLWTTLKVVFDSVEARIDDLRDAPDRPITIGVTTYFASRWLSPRLMLFLKAHPDLDNPLNRRAFRDTLPRFSKSPAALDPARYARFAEFMKEQGLIDAIAPLDSYAITLR